MRFLTTVAGSVALTGAAFATANIWAGLYMPWKGSLAIAGLTALGIPWILNKGLTARYRKIDRSASEWNSLFGMALATHLVLLPALYFGAGGSAGRISVAEAARQGAVQAGVLDPIDEATLSSYPLSEVDTGITWVPNLGTPERPLVVARQDDGELKAVYLPEAGEKVTAHNRTFVVGPAERTASRVMLCPVPEGGEGITRNRTVRVPYEDGVVTFRLLGRNHSMSISGR
jgi:hypothetical protein